MFQIKGLLCGLTAHTTLFDIEYCRLNEQGRSDGVDIGIYTPEISPSKLLWGKNDVRTAIQQFYTPQKTFITPKNKFLATPLLTRFNPRYTLIR